MTSLEEILRPPSEAEVATALERFKGLVTKAYGDRLVALYLFGSRARGDHRPDSDADIAVVLEDGPGRFWDETMRLTDIASEIRIDDGVDIQAWPFGRGDWLNPEQSRQARLIAGAQEHGRLLP